MKDLILELRKKNLITAYRLGQIDCFTFLDHWKHLTLALVAVLLTACGSSSGSSDFVSKPSHVGRWVSTGTFCANDGSACGPSYNPGTCTTAPQHPATLSATQGLNVFGAAFEISPDGSAVLQAVDAPSFTFDGEALYGSHGFDFQWVDISEGEAVIVWIPGCALKYERE